VTPFPSGMMAQSCDDNRVTSTPVILKAEGLKDLHVSSLLQDEACVSLFEAMVQSEADETARVVSMSTSQPS